jgi:hypothetical protein
MPRKTKRTYQKQKQQQVQKVIVNVGEKVKPKRKRRARRPKQPSQEAQEYAQSISQIIPKIQYNFPQHSSFNYDRDTKDYGVNSRPLAMGETSYTAAQSDQAVKNQQSLIALNKPQTENMKENLAQQMDKGFTRKSDFKDADFVVKKPEPNNLNIKTTEPASAMGRELPINNKDKEQSLTQGFNEFAKNEQKSFVQETKEASQNQEKATQHIQDEKKKLAKQRKTYKPSDKIILEGLTSRGLPNTPENRKQFVDEYIKRREETTASELRRERKKTIETQDKELERMGMVSRLKSRPKNTILDSEEVVPVPLMENKKVVTLADLQEKAKSIAQLEKKVTIKKPKKAVVVGDKEHLSSVVNSLF